MRILPHRLKNNAIAAIHTTSTNNTIPISTPRTVELVCGYSTYDGGSEKVVDEGGSVEKVPVTPVCGDVLGGGSCVRKTIGRLRYFLPPQTAATVSWYCVSGLRPLSVTASELPATIATTLKLASVGLYVTSYLSTCWMDISHETRTDVGLLRKVTVMFSGTPGPPGIEPANPALCSRITVATKIILATQGVPRCP